MLDDRDRRELAEMERQLRTDDPELVRAFSRSAACGRPGAHRPVRTIVAAVALLLLAVLLLGVGLTVVLLVAAAVVMRVLDGGDRAGQAGRIGRRRA